MKKKILLSVTALLTLSCPAHPLLAADQPPTESELTALYFDSEDTEQTTTRAPKLLSQVAENVTIVTADEIAAMRAHTLAEVLERQPGVFTSFATHDFLSDDFEPLLGASEHHTLVLLDGVRVNLNSGGDARTNFIPLTIIKRIEIIKGAASAAWGSALGGVINIITKDGGKSPVPTGSVSASYGEGRSRDVAADMAGQAAGVEYYLHGGNIDSNGLERDRYGERDSAYAKLSKKLGDKTALTVSGGYSDPYWKNLNWSDPWGVTGLDIYEDVRSKNVWGAVSLDSRLRDNLTLYLSGQHFDNDFTANKCSLGTGSLGIPRGELIDRNFWQDEANSLAGRLNWMRDSLTANLGFETSRSEMRFAYTLGPLWGPFHTEDEPVREERRGVYANATYGAGDFSVTPGLRYDYNSNSDEFISPSLGLTYLLAPDTLLRGVIASGFSAPYLAAISHSPDLEAETTWTYQAGVETSRLPHLRCKATLFYHDIDDAWKVNETPWTNTGTKRINGVELEGQTDAFHGLSFTANFTLANEDSQDVENDESYTANLIFDYHLKDLGLRTQVAGHYHWMNTGGEEPSYDDFLWDLLIGKDFTLSALSGEIYLKAHNIFNGSQYWDLEFPNPERWLEAGIAFTF